MGWYRIDPETGHSADSHSALSQPPDVVLLNAVPGVDDDAAACYLGDGPWDMGSSFVTGFRELLPKGSTLTPAEARQLLLEKALPTRLAAESEKLLQSVTAFWADIDGCYEDDWERPANEAEKRWIYEDVVQRLCGG